MKNSIIKEKSFNFALEIIDLYKILQEQKEYIYYQNNFLEVPQA